MERNKERIKEAEQALKAAYNARTAPPVTDRWRKGVMADLRRITDAPLSRTKNEPTAITWRFAAATSLSALILLLYSFNAGIWPEHEAARMFLFDPLGFIVSQSFLP